MYHLCNVYRLGSGYCFAAVSVYYSVHVCFVLDHLYCLPFCPILLYYYKTCHISLVTQTLKWTKCFLRGNKLVKPLTQWQKKRFFHLKCKSAERQGENPEMILQEFWQPLPPPDSWTIMNPRPADCQQRRLDQPEDRHVKNRIQIRNKRESLGIFLPHCRCPEVSLLQIF